MRAGLAEAPTALGDTWAPRMEEGPRGPSQSRHPHLCPLRVVPVCVCLGLVQAGTNDLVCSPVHLPASPLQCELHAWHTVVLDACLLGPSATPTRCAVSPLQVRTEVPAHRAAVRVCCL